MLRWIVACIGLVLAPVVQASAEEVRMADGRSYRIDLPADPQGAPIILALHGGGGNPDQIARNSGLSGPATAKGYAVIYPAGSARGGGRLLTWNAGDCCAYAAMMGIDDMAFLDRVIADAVRRFGVADDRVYLTGMSNGSMMAERYAAARPGRVKAVAGVAGTLDPQFRVKGPVALLHIHGTADDRVPYEGGPGQTRLTQSVTFHSVDDTVAAFAAAAGPMAQTQGIIAKPPDGTRVIRRDWHRAGGQVMVSLLTVEGGGHVWPGGRRAGTKGFDATDEILRFFDAHP